MNKSGRGFTLIEALLSSLILALGAVVISGLSHRCARNSIRGWEYEQAYRLLDECLDTVVAGKIDLLTHKKSIEGDFGHRYPKYKYKIKAEPAGSKDIMAEDLYEVTAIVIWDVSGQEYQVHATTLVYDFNE